MATNDNEQERLRSVYADKTEGELQVLAADAASLTPEAAQALEGEIARRKLDFVLSKSTNPPDEVYAPADEQVTIRTFRDLVEAKLAKGVLDSAGIPCVVIDENTGRMLGAKAVGGIRMQVSRTDANAALQLLTPNTSDSCACGSTKQVFGCKSTSAQIAVRQSS